MKKMLLLIVIILTGLIFIGPRIYAEEDAYEFLEQGNALIDSNLFTQKESYEEYDQGVVDMSAFTMALENDNYRLHVNPEGLAIRIEDKSDGYIWASDLVNLSDYQMSTSWIRRTLSSIYIDYVDDENRALSTSVLHRRSNENPLTSYSAISADTVRFTLDFIEEEIYLEYDIVLTDKGFDVTFDTEKVNEYGTNRLTKITFFEFMGTSYLDDIPGYHFLPSGNGALIRFTDNSPVNTPYRARYFGQDKYRSASSSQTMLDYPVFGSVNGVNQNGFLAIITEGSEYSEYSYSPPTFQTAFHLQSNTFFLRENYIQMVSGGQSLLIYERDLKDYDPSVSYVFLKDENANYVGMAKAFKDYMVEQGMLDEKIVSKDKIGIHIDTIGREYEQGLLFKQYYNMTTVDDILAINTELTSFGVENILFSMRGYNSGGYSKRSYENYSFDRALGDVDRLADLSVLFYYDPTVMYTDNDVVPDNTMQTISRSALQLSIDRGEYYKYYIDVDAFLEEFPEAMEKLSSYGGVALDGMSNELNSNQAHTRTEIVDLYDDILAEKMAMYRPNYFMIDNASAYLLTSLYHNRSRFFTDSVPFEQILLSGYLPMYSQYLNFSPNLNIDRLKLIEYGIYPGFLITMQPSYLLSNTMSRDFYATYYGNLDQYIIDTYIMVNDALQYTIGYEIVEREVLAVGVVRVEYSNGINIYVNYTENPYVTKDIAVGAFGYYVEGQV